ncbi:MAG: hypothetical protein H0T39_14785 [Actinobacteria bacterium]|nr:hypothetical protein [Actinomycetota bacterium]
MRRFWSQLNPTLRGFGIIVLIALVIVLLQLEQTLVSLFLLARIAFFLAIAFVLYLFWRDRRDDIGSWSQRSRAVFYGGAALILVDLAAYFWPGRTTAGPDALAFLLVLAAAGFAMFRVWRDEHTYSV